MYVTALEPCTQEMRDRLHLKMLMTSSILIESEQRITLDVSDFRKHSQERTRGGLPDRSPRPKIMSDNLTTMNRRLVLESHKDEETPEPIPSACNIRITDHAQIGRLTAAYSLLSNAPLKVMERGDRIVVEVGTEHRVYREFKSEYDLILWLYRQVRDYSQESLKWFRAHEQSFSTNGL